MAVRFEVSQLRDGRQQEYEYGVHVGLQCPAHKTQRVVAGCNGRLVGAAMTLMLYCRRSFGFLLRRQQMSRIAARDGAAHALTAAVDRSRHA